LKDRKNRLTEPVTAKASDEQLMDELKAQNQRLSSQLTKMQKKQTRLIVLEKELKIKEEILSQSRQSYIKVKELFEQEKQSKEQLQSALLSKTAVIKELQERLNDMESLLGSFQNSPNIDRETKERITKESVFQREKRQPNPVDIIDWVIKKKSEQSDPSRYSPMLQKSDGFTAPRSKPTG
jgi:chromosome segregation ATPase